jgi:hypothetical protein
MTMAEIVALTQQFMDVSTSGRQKYTDAFVLSIANIIYREICREAKCGVLTKDTITTVDSTREYDFPTAYSMMVRVEYQDGNNYKTKLNPIHFNSITDDTGYPLQYYLTPNKIGLDPEPDGVYTINRYFYQGPTTSLTAEETPSMVNEGFHHVIACGAAAWIFGIDKSEQSGGYQKWSAKYAEELLKFKTYINEQQNQDSYIPVT